MNKEPIQVLDKGFIQLIDTMGDDNRNDLDEEMIHLQRDYLSQIRDALNQIAAKD